MNYKIYLQFDSLPESLNKSLRSHFRKRSQLNKSWDLMVEMAVDGKRPKRPISKANITIIRHSHRMLDFDGLVGSMKPVVDALVTAKVLIDDSWGVTGQWNVTQKFRSAKNGPLLEVLIQSMPTLVN